MEPSSTFTMRGVPAGEKTAGAKVPAVVSRHEVRLPRCTHTGTVPDVRVDQGTIKFTCESCAYSTGAGFASTVMEVPARSAGTRPFRNVKDAPVWGPNPLPVIIMISPGLAAIRV